MLVIRDLVKYFGKGTVNEVLALNGISLSVKPGEFICVIGSNGAGKSSLMNAVAGTSLPDGGSIRLDKSDITLLPEYKRAALIGRVFQDPLSGTCAGMTIEENMALALRRGKPRGLAKGVRRADTELFRERLARLDLGLESRLKDRAGLLSGGQRQSLTMLMATLTRPKLLLLDEHTAALDPKTAQLIMALTEEIIQKEQLTALMITHNLHQALAHGNRLIMMHQGRIVLDMEGEQKAKISVEELLLRFSAATEDAGLTDRMFLSH